MFNFLPKEIKKRIFVNLSVFDFSKTSRVSKEWKELTKARIDDILKNPKLPGQLNKKQLISFTKVDIDHAKYIFDNNHLNYSFNLSDLYEIAKISKELKDIVVKSKRFNDLLSLDPDEDSAGLPYKIVTL